MTNTDLKNKVPPNVKSQPAREEKKKRDSSKASPVSRGRMRIMTGQVISDKAQKTISVLIYRQMLHKKYKKYIRKKSVFKAHDEKEQAHTGDIVKIYETRPLSKTKRWKLLQVISSPAPSPAGDNPQAEV